jgi:hypothetical protein
MQIKRYAIAPTLAALLGPASSIATARADAAPGPDATPAVARQACPVEELAFTRETGCLNDGAVEFCLPRSEPDHQAELRALAPDLQCFPGAASSGRVGCDTRVSYLCLLPLGSAHCTPDSPALTDAGWQLVCAIAARPYVERIVPTWFE